jgi:hypothetical protein
MTRSILYPSISVTDLLPDNDTGDADTVWQDYCETAAQLDPIVLLDIALNELKNENSPLLDAIHEAIRYPYEPGCPPKVNASDALRLGKALIAFIAKITDDQVTLIQAGGGPLMRWWRRDHELRAELQACQSKCRLALLALGTFRERFVPLALYMPISDAAELLVLLERAENLLDGIEEGGVV